MRANTVIRIQSRSSRTTISALFFFLLIVSFTVPAHGADGDESVIFLHHSTGGAVYSQGDVAAWIADYNTTHATAYQITERAYPNSPYPWANYPYDYWNLWINGACDSSTPNIECMDSLTQGHDVIIYKHCFPGAGVLADTGAPDIASSRKSLENYKLQYRALRDLMDDYADNRFIVWTLAPLHRLATDAQTAQRAKDFVDWVNNEWLTEDGQTHDNIFIFDFWGHAAESDPNPEYGMVNTLRYEYENSHTGTDSHPNSLANETIGPVFAQFIVDTIEAAAGSNPAPDDPPADNSPGTQPDTGSTNSGDGSGCFIWASQQPLLN